jgi:hypothetical protein
MKILKKLSLYICTLILTISISGVAYAGFSRQYTPEVKGFGIQVATQENMLISTTGEAGSFKDIVTYDELLESTHTNLLPLKATVEPTDNQYNNITLRNNSDATRYTTKWDEALFENTNSEYIAFNLFFTSSDNMNLYLGNDRVRNIITIDESATGNLSFTSEQKEKLLSSMRIGFFTYETTYPIDYSGLHIKYSPSPVKANVYATTTTNDTYSSYMFNQVGYNTTTGDGTVIATTKPGSATKIKVVIWLESANLDTTLLTAIAHLRFNIAFQAVKINVI